MTSALDSRTKLVEISTHTLTWSVTAHGVKKQVITPISTHTLTWSVTCKEFYKNCKYSHFNSHAHVERDRVLNNFIVKSYISTHTLTWSVTGAYDSMTDTLYNFNSHAHVERD